MVFVNSMSNYLLNVRSWSYFNSTKFSPMEKLEVLKTTFEKINEVGLNIR